MKISKKDIHKYLITKYMGGGANVPPAKNIQFELNDNYKFEYTKVFGKRGLTIKNKK